MFVLLYILAELVRYVWQPANALSPVLFASFALDGFFYGTVGLVFFFHFNPKSWKNSSNSRPSNIQFSSSYIASVYALEKCIGVGKIWARKASERSACIFQPIHQFPCFFLYFISILFWYSSIVKFKYSKVYLSFTFRSHQL